MRRQNDLIAFPNSGGGEVDLERVGGIAHADGIANPAVLGQAVLEVVKLTLHDKGAASGDTQDRRFQLLAVLRKHVSIPEKRNLHSYPELRGSAANVIGHEHQQKNSASLIAWRSFEYVQYTRRKNPQQATNSLRNHRADVESRTPLTHAPRLP